MSDQSPRRFSRDTTERLLRGEGDPAHVALAGLLAAAAAPASGGEIPGEEQALSAFRKAWSTPIDLPITTPRRRSMLQATVAKALTAKGIAVCLAACTGAGAVGVTVAASTGALPDPIAKALGVAKKHVPPTPKVPTPAISTPAIPAPGLPANYEQLVKLCNKFDSDEAQGGAGGAGVADLHSKNFAALVWAAGGSDTGQVKAYCLKLIQHAPSGVPSAPGGVPSGVPSGFPHGLPSGLPTGLPGKPTWKPTWPPHPTPSLPINVHPHS